jgi:hypothetical protein
MHSIHRFHEPVGADYRIGRSVSAGRAPSDTVADVIQDCTDNGLIDDLRAALAVESHDAQGSTLQAVRDLVYELAGAQNRDLAVDVLIYATGVAEFDLTSLRDYARKHGLTPEGFRQHVLKLQRRLGLPPRAMQHSDAN